MFVIAIREIQNLIDETQVWSQELFFVKPIHNFGTK